MALRSFGEPSHALVDYQIESGGIPLYGVVEVFGKRGATTENQGTGARHTGYGVPV